MFKKKRNLSCWIEEKLGNIRTGFIKKNSKNKDHSIRKFAKIKDHIRTIGAKILGKYKDHFRPRHPSLVANLYGNQTTSTHSNSTDHGLEPLPLALLPLNPHLAGATDLLGHTFWFQHNPGLIGMGQNSGIGKTPHPACIFSVAYSSIHTQYLTTHWLGNQNITWRFFNVPPGGLCCSRIWCPTLTYSNAYFIFSWCWSQLVRRGYFLLGWRAHVCGAEIQANFNRDRQIQRTLLPPSITIFSKRTMQSWVAKCS